MTIEAMPIGVRCNLKCTYCYQDTVRTEETPKPYSMERMTAALQEEVVRSGAAGGYVVFGGEPLLIPISDLETFLKQSFDLSGQSGIQTNGSLITSDHIALFKKYNTHVGVSIDGPGELNNARPSETTEATKSTTEKSEAAILWLLKEGIGCSLILTLHRYNASEERLTRLVRWLAELHEAGLQNANLHLMEVDSPAAAQIRLTDEETLFALRTLHSAEPVMGVRLLLFEQMLLLLRGTDGSTNCIWNACDPGTTSAVRAIGPIGEQLNCARTYKTPTTWIKAEKSSHMRQLALYATPQEDGGCKDCRFFLMCKGQCPGEAINGDPRNRSSYCAVWYSMFEFLESRLLDARIVPISLDPRRPILESLMLSEWREGRSVTIEKALSILSGQLSNRPDLAPGQHGDWHADHSDAARTFPKRISR